MSNSSIHLKDEKHKHEILLCKRCGQSFECKVGDIAQCQCTAVPIDIATTQFLGKTDWGCLCVKCLAEIDAVVRSMKGESFPKPDEVREGYHYYIENGLWVFTERYHILRGNCCKSGCRHCAYGYEKK